MFLYTCILTLLFNCGPIKLPCVVVLVSTIKLLYIHLLITTVIYQELLFTYKKGMYTVMSDLDPSKPVGPK